MEDGHLSKAHDTGTTSMPGRALYHCTPTSHGEDSNLQEGARTDSESERYLLAMEPPLPSNSTPATKAMLEWTKANSAKLRG